MRNMAKAPARPHPKPRKAYRPTFLRAWRIHEGLSQDRLIDRLPVNPETALPLLSKTSLSRIEQGKQPYTQETLEALAHALGCKPEDLIMRDPSKKDAPWSIWETVRSLPKDRLIQVEAVIQALGKTGTDK